MDIKKQGVEGVENSTINQAGRDIIVNGLGYKDVADICHDVVRRELNIVTNVALKKFKSDVEEYKEELISGIRKEANSQGLLQKFQNPDIHFTLHDSIRSYSSVKDRNQKEIIVESMIERLKTEETDVEKFIIDEAISVLPRINKRIGFMLVAMFRRNIINPGPGILFKDILKDIPNNLSDITDITKLDMAYMEQLGCVNNLQGTQQYKSYEEILLNNYDLYFRKYPNRTVLEDYIDAHPILATPIVENINVPIFIIQQDDSTTLYFTNHKLARAYISANQEYLRAFEEFLNITPIMSVEEVKKHLIILNPKWKAILDLLNTERIKNYELSSVGGYIANVLHSKLFQTKKMSLTDIY